MNDHQFFRDMKDRLSSRAPSAATIAKWERRKALADVPTSRQIAFAQSLRIEVTGLTRSELSDRIDAAVKASDARRAAEAEAARIAAASRPTVAPAAPAQRAKNTSISRHSKVAVVRALAARGLTLEQISTAMAVAKLERDLLWNRTYWNRIMAEGGKTAELTADDLKALGVEGGAA